jgi:hypothetical protein
MSYLDPSLAVYVPQPAGAAHTPVYLWVSGVGWMRGETGMREGMGRVEDEEGPTSMCEHDHPCHQSHYYTCLCLFHLL